jgi:hypothetical protein
VATARAAENVSRGGVPAGQKQIYTVAAQNTGAGADAAGQAGTRPVQEEDRKKIDSVLGQRTRDLAMSQDPQGSDTDRARAQKKLDKSAGVAEDPRFRESLDQVKSYKASATCVSMIETRTQQAGWPYGFLWGLASSACDEPRAAGAEDRSSRWSELFACVEGEPFSTCATHLPKE